MKEVSKNFASYLQEFKFSTLKIPVVLNVYARLYRESDIIKNLTEQITYPVKWGGQHSLYSELW
jgi:trans-AT polyketide synthase, acyltransferase and oxidoreductase domains